jgi:hypothetical protein
MIRKTVNRQSAVARRPVHRGLPATGLRNCLPDHEFARRPDDHPDENKSNALLVVRTPCQSPTDDENDDDLRHRMLDRRRCNSLPKGLPGRGLCLTAAGGVTHALVMSDQPGEFGIPEEFWSAYLEGPFESCVDCGASLQGGSLPYAIQKHVVAGETVFEMAMCMDCATNLQSQFSVESRQALQEQIRVAAERVRRQQEAESDRNLASASREDLPALLAQIEARHRMRLERALAECALCGTPRSGCHRYSLGTACVGTALLSAAPDADNLGSPFLICENCELRLNECLSQQTRDAWNRFVEETFDGPPSLAVDPREMLALF